MASLSGHGRRFVLRGTIQGVGFRPFVARSARRLGLRGRVWNAPGSVFVEVWGDPKHVCRLGDLLRQPRLLAANVEHCQEEALEGEGPADFRIISSREEGPGSPALPADLPLCRSCRRELLDPRNRRHSYPFLGCTDCGPRFTVATGTPFDRARTSLAAFPPCPECRAEYADPRRRRYHAETISCPACGPQLWFEDSPGRRSPEAPFPAASRLLAEGGIVAVRGVGGFHLAVDATNEAAVLRLRERKHRESRPFAVMVANLATARTMARVSRPAAALLLQPARPIVLLDRRDSSHLAPSVSGDSPWTGVFLPYSALHELLLRHVGCPLVLTSGNLTEEPMVLNNEAARTRLAGLADGFLLHDLEITNRCEDSVLRCLDGTPTLIRRGRGYVPEAIPLSQPVSESIVGVGGHLKNAICVLDRDRAWFGPPIGDLTSEEACLALEELLETFPRFLRVQPRVVAHDLHPDYASTRIAEGLGWSQRVPVQHHHAHARALLAEHEQLGPALVLAWDGTGYGWDGSSWGSELLLVDGARCERVGTFRPLLLPGGDRAVREVWRVALAVLEDAWEGDPPLGRLPVFREVPPSAVSLVRQAIRSPGTCPKVHGMGRFFDAAGALGLGRPIARHEAEVATAWMAAARPGPAAPYPFAQEEGEPPRIDLRPLFRALVDDLLAGQAASRISARFHSTLVAAAVSQVRAATKRYGALPVGLTGGCFQNPHLVRGLRRDLATDGLEVLVHRRVPPNDGGLALGQALVAAETLNLLPAGSGIR